MAQDAPKRDQRSRWPVDADEQTRKIVRVLAAWHGIGAEKMAGQLLASAASVAYADFMREQAPRVAEDAKPAPKKKPLH